VKVTVETGFVGLALFLYLLWLMLREGMALFRTARDPFYQRLGLGLIAVIVCTVLVNFFGDRWMYQQITAYMWTYLGLVTRARMLDAQESTQVAELARESLPQLEETPA